MWTNEEIEYVKNNYTQMADKVIANILNKKSAGTVRCLRRKMGLIKPRIKDLTGLKIDDVTVIRNTGKQTERHSVIWECLTNDGRTIEIPAYNLKPGRTKLAKGLSQNVRDGRSKERLYEVWKNMKHKCDTPSNGDYKYYGARGITYADEWRDYNNFKTWAFSNGYVENHNRKDCTLDRIDVNGNYEPNNCRWVNMSVQSNNRRNYGKYPYYGLVDNNGRYQVQLTVNGEKVIIGRTRNADEIPYLLELRNKYIDEHHLLNKKNDYDPNIEIPTPIRRR